MSLAGQATTGAQQAIGPARRIVVTGSIAAFADLLDSALTARGHDVLRVSSDRPEPVPATNVMLVESVPHQPLREALVGAEVVVLLTGLGPVLAMVDDAAALDLIEAYAAAGVTLIELSSFAVFGDRGPGGGAPVDEASEPRVPAGLEPVRAAELRTLATGEWLRPVVVRSGLVYSAGGGTLLSAAVDRARNDGVSRYAGGPNDAYPLIHQDDLVALLVRLCEDPGARGVYHAVGETIEAAELARLVAAAARVSPVQLWSDEDLAAELQASGPLPRVSVRARSTRGTTIGWSATAPSVVHEMRRTP